MQPKSSFVVLYTLTTRTTTEKNGYYTHNECDTCNGNRLLPVKIALGYKINTLRHYRFLVSLPFFFPFFLSLGNSNFVNFSSSVMVESI